MTGDELLQARMRAAWARSILLGAASIACMIMFLAFIRGLPPGSGRALQALDLGIGAIQAWAALFGATGAAGLVTAVAGWRANWLIILTGALFGAWGFVFLGAWIAGEQATVVGAVWLLLNDVLLSALLLLPARRSR